MGGGGGGDDANVNFVPESVVATLFAFGERVCLALCKIDTGGCCLGGGKFTFSDSSLGDDTTVVFFSICCFVVECLEDELLIFL